MIFNNKIEIQLGLRCYQGGGSTSQSEGRPQATPQQMLQIYGQALPGILGTTSAQATPTAQALAGAASSANPIYTNSVLNQLKGSGTGYVNTGNDLSQTQAAGQNALLTGTGGQAAGSAATLNARLNQTQGAANTQGANLLNSINLNGLSPGEFNATERANNQNLTSTGNLGVDNPTNTLSNAMNFGGAFNNKIGILGNALNQTAGVSANQQTQVNPVGTALGAGNLANNFGANLFNPSQANSNLTVPFSAASALGNQVASVSSASNTNSGSGESHGGICFLTTVACEYKGLPDDCKELQILRSFRNTTVPVELIDEYNRIAPSIVEKIKGVKEHMDYIWSVVQECIKDINEGYNADAIAKYRMMVIKLQNL